VDCLNVTTGAGNVRIHRKLSALLMDSGMGTTKARVRRASVLSVSLCETDAAMKHDDARHRNGEVVPSRSVPAWPA